MKKFFFLFTLLILVSMVSFGNVNRYRVNDTQIESLFAQAEQAKLPALIQSQCLDGLSLPIATEISRKSVKNAWVAWALTYTSCIGICGVHRLYLGTSPGVFVGYFCTLGGCGIVQLVDWVVLLIGAINDDIGEYIDNREFFMWL